MDDIAGKLNQILSDPDGIDKIKQLAGSLFSDQNDSADDKQTDSSEFDIFKALSNVADNTDNSSSSLGFDPMKLMGLISVLGKSGDDKRTGLLLALKPHLSAERQLRVDKAVKYLKIAALLPLLKEQGLFDML